LRRSKIDLLGNSPSVFKLASAWHDGASYFVPKNCLLERLKLSLGANARHVVSETSAFGLDL
jgi:hypothetical protein